MKTNFKNLFALALSEGIEELQIQYSKVDRLSFQYFKGEIDSYKASTGAGLLVTGLYQGKICCYSTEKFDKEDFPSIVAALKGTEYDTGLDLVLLNEIREYFMGLRKKYIESGLLDQSMLATNTKALIYQVPGGMLSNLLSQLKQAGKADQLEDVLQEVPRVRKDAGYPPLVTPTSQIVGTQAVFNVINGERYKMCTNEFKDLVSGKYGTTPVPVDPEFAKKVNGGKEIITCRPADLLEPELETLRKECAEWIEQEEDVLSYAQFPKVALDFFKKRRDAKYGIDGKHADAEKEIHPV